MTNLPPHPSPLPQGARERTRAAFTLAEVLITLGIIGIVAAMTIPTLMAKVRRNNVETHLRKFHSTINQAIRMSISEHDNIPFWSADDLVDVHNADKIYDWYNEYIVKYLSGANIKKLNNDTVRITLKDGTGFASFLQYEPGYQTGLLWIFYCIDPNKNCVSHKNYDGKNSFLFQYRHNDIIVMPARADYPEQACKNNCYMSITENSMAGQCCAELIRRNSWKIPKDYPWL